VDSVQYSQVPAIYLITHPFQPRGLSCSTIVHKPVQSLVDPSVPAGATIFGIPAVSLSQCDKEKRVQSDSAAHAGMKQKRL
jgi:hypothetical protein